MTPTQKRYVSLILGAAYLRESPLMMEGHMRILDYHLREGRLQGIKKEEALAYAKEKGYI